MAIASSRSPAMKSRLAVAVVEFHDSGEGLDVGREHDPGLFDLLGLQQAIAMALIWASRK